MDYDVAVIGAGWSGFNAALRAKELGLKVALIEKAAIGGTCLNAGCIPTKALLQSAKIYTLIHKAKTFGVEASAGRVCLADIQKRKNDLIGKLRLGMQSMLRGVDFLAAEARFLSASCLKAGEKEIHARSVILSCGSRPVELAALRFDHVKILSSTDILDISEVPASLLIVGGGVIGCEFATLFCGLGSSVTVAEKMPQLLPGEDPDVARKLEGIFKKRGITVLKNADAASLDPGAFAHVLVCVGRAPDTEGLGLDAAGIRKEKNSIAVDEYLKASVPNVYASGDCNGSLMLAHNAAFQGRVAAENVAHPDHPRKVTGAIVPSCIFTEPEIASVGMREEEARRAGIGVVVHRFDFQGSGMARILEEADGFIKILSDQKTGCIIGASIIGPRATETAAALTLAVTNRLTAEQVSRTIFAHPTVSEAIAEALHSNSAHAL